MPRRREAQGATARTAAREGEVLIPGHYVSRKARRQPCTGCGMFAHDSSLVLGLGRAVGRFCEACWGGIAEAYAPRLAGEDALDRYYQRTYGISLADYGQRFLQQQGGCAICKARPTAEAPLAVDHDHATGAVRGLLCRGCNVGLGCFSDNVASMGRAIAYLMESK